MNKVLCFVDGENLVFRYQEMRAAGRLPHTNHVIHVPDVFVWSRPLTKHIAMEILRVSYYTSVVGDPDKVTSVSEQIADVAYSSPGASIATHIIPRVHKKPASSRKTKVVDVDMTMDIMRAALQMPIDGIFILSGDADFIPLIREITRATSKQVYLGAFSSGLADGLRQGVEFFLDLDNLFFQPLPQSR